jgi:hypothetical protein
MCGDLNAVIDAVSFFYVHHYVLHDLQALDFHCYSQQLLLVLVLHLAALHTL